MGRQYYYYQSIRKTIIQFLNLFRNIQIERLNAEGTVTGYKKVPLKFGIKEKVWYWLHQKRNDEMLPIISVILNTVEYASDRQTNKMRSVVKSTSHSAGELNKFLNPVPYNFGFTMSIWSLYMVDVDQILEQILPYFTPMVFIRINIPELDATLDLKAIFQSCAPDVSMEMADEDVRVIKWNLDFMVQGYLFQPLKTTGIITKVIQKIYGNEHSWGSRFTETVFTSGGGQEMVALYTKAIAPYFDEDDWIANTSYDIGDLAKPTTANGYLYEVVGFINEGYSGTTEPTWPTTKSTPVVDNDIIWERYQHDDYKRLVELEHFGD
ncbi:tail sheath stabilizer and completion protein [Patescibacteria group bacterium]|nr:tail sheath stabilizer and completion protein [Patescibacteria group bacterium]